MRSLISDAMKLVRADRRPAAKSRPPLVEAMEGRAMLSTAPLMTISDPIVYETAGVSSSATFTVRLTKPAASTITVDYSTSNATALDGVDYLSAGGRVTFAPGESQKTVSITVLDDTAIEPSETFRVSLSNAVGAVPVKTIGVAAIQDNDTVITPLLSIGNVSMTRGLSGTKAMNFTVSLNTAATTPVTVTAATRNVTAFAGTDYLAKRETLTFAPGETTKQFSVTVFGKSTPTPDKIFYVDLSGASIGLKVKTGAGVLRYGT